MRVRVRRLAMASSIDIETSGDEEGIPLEPPRLPRPSRDASDIVPIDMTDEEVAMHLDVAVDPTEVMYGRRHEALHREVGHTLGGLQRGNSQWITARKAAANRQSSVRSHVGKQRENVAAFLTAVRPVSLQYSHVSYILAPSIVGRVGGCVPIVNRYVNSTRQTLLTDLSGTFPPGSMVAIIGPSGAPPHSASGTALVPERERIRHRHICCCCR